MAAIRAAQLGQKVAVIEDDRPGGVCLNWGCIPSKALLTGQSSSRTCALMAMSSASARAASPSTTTSSITHSRKTADRLSKGIESLFRKNKITLVRGHGRLSGATRVDVTGAEQTVVEAAHILLATVRGSGCPGMAVDGRHILTSREALESRTIPARLVVIGAGAVGVEFAYVYAMYGAQVIVLEMADQMLPGADPEVAEVLQREFRRKKIEVRLGTRFEEAEARKRWRAAAGLQGRDE